MSIYTKVDTGVQAYRTMLPSRDRWCGTVDFFRLYGAQTRFLVPGDIWKEQVNCFIRLNPMLTPSLTPMKATIRWFYVPLRLVYDNTELTITGSKDGSLSSETLPTAPSILSSISSTNWNFDNRGWIYITKDSIAHTIFELPAGKFYYANKDAKSLPRLYWLKAYARIWWDYYRDENLAITLTITPNSVDTYHPSSDSYTIDNSDFEDFFDWLSKSFTRLRCLPICLPKDYFTSALPWQLKGVAPTISFNVSQGLQWNNISSDVTLPSDTVVGFRKGVYSSSDDAVGLATTGTAGSFSNTVNQNVQAFLDNIGFSATAAFNADDMRDMFAQTRVFERLARTGSRYIEYLRANFGIAPSDGTLQRPEYLGGFKQDILTTEVLQTGGDPNGTSTPIGTMRGHGISSATNSMKPYVNKEFGMLFATFEIKPRIQYTQGIRRELTYGSRYEFFNPSFQRLSEQEVRIGEIYFKNNASDNSENDGTFGFQGMYNELRSGKERFFGEMLDTQAQWNQAIQFTSQPSLNGAFINGTSYASSFLRPFGLSNESEDTKPVIVDFYASNSPLRPMIRNPTPGLIDHN